MYMPLILRKLFLKKCPDFTMTTYTRGGPEYTPKPDFTSWLDVKGFPAEYHDIFSWPRERVYAEYDRLFTRAEEIGEQIKQTNEQSASLVRCKVLPASLIAAISEKNVPSSQDF